MKIGYNKARPMGVLLGLCAIVFVQGCQGNGPRGKENENGALLGQVTMAADEPLANRCAIDPIGDLESRLVRDPQYVMAYRSGADPCSVSAPTTDRNLGHRQGIQRLARGDRNFFAVTSSVQKGAAGFEVVQLDSRGSTQETLGENASPGGWPGCDDRVVAYGAFPEDARNHAGGIQVMGSHLIVPMEDSTYVQVGAFRLVDLSHPATPVLGELIPRQRGATRNSGEAALTRLGDESFLAMIFGWDAAEAEIFLSTATSPSLAAVDWRSTWAGSMPSGFPAYQNLQFLTQCDGRLFLVGTFRDGAGNDIVDLWRFELFVVEDEVELILSKATSVTLGCRSPHTGDASYCDFNAGAGAYVSAKGRVHVYGVEPHNDAVAGSDRAVKVREFFSE